MSLTVEDAQKVLDLRARMLSNIQEGKPAHEGITPDVYKTCLDAVRGARAKAAEVGAKKVAKKAAKAKNNTDSALATPQTSVATNPKFAKFLNKSFE